MDLRETLGPMEKSGLEQVDYSKSSRYERSEGCGAPSALHKSSPSSMFGDGGVHANERKRYFKLAYPKGFFAHGRPQWKRT